MRENALTEGENLHLTIPRLPLYQHEQVGNIPIYGIELQFA